MTENVRFCQYILRGARLAAKQAKVELPKRITAITSDRHQFFVEADGMAGCYVEADNAYDAKAKYIYALVDKATGGTK